MTYEPKSLIVLRHICQCPAGYGYPLATKDAKHLKQMKRDGLVESVPGIGCTIYKATAKGRRTAIEITPDAKE